MIRSGAPGARFGRSWVARWPGDHGPSALPRGGTGGRDSEEGQPGHRRRRATKLAADLKKKYDSGASIRAAGRGDRPVLRLRAPDAQRVRAWRCAVAAARPAARSPDPAARRSTGTPPVRRPPVRRRASASARRRTAGRRRPGRHRHARHAGRAAQRADTGDLAGARRDRPATSLGAPARVVVLRAEGASFSRRARPARCSRPGARRRAGLAELAALVDAELDATIAAFQEAFTWWRDERRRVASPPSRGTRSVPASSWPWPATCGCVADDVQFAMRETSLGLVPDLDRHRSRWSRWSATPARWRSALPAAGSAPRRPCALGLASLVVPAATSSTPPPRPGRRAARAHPRAPCARPRRCCAARRPARTTSSAPPSAPRRLARLRDLAARAR